LTRPDLTLSFNRADLRDMKMLVHQISYLFEKSLNLNDRRLSKIEVLLDIFLSATEIENGMEGLSTTFDLILTFSGWNQVK
jgi:hypothetical protein